MKIGRIIPKTDPNETGIIITFYNKTHRAELEILDNGDIFATMYPWLFQEDHTEEVIVLSNRIEFENDIIHKPNEMLEKIEKYLGNKEKI